jgi:hypothetical protein
MGKLGWLIGGPLGWAIEEGAKAFSASEEMPVTATEAVREDEIARVIKLIEQGRNQGLTELEIQVSHGLARDFAVEGGAPVEGIPANIGFKIGQDASGSFVLKISYLPKSTVDKLRDLKKLYDENVISEDEFRLAKAELLKQL